MRKKKRKRRRERDRERERERGSISSYGESLLLPKVKTQKERVRVNYFFAKDRKIEKV